MNNFIKQVIEEKFQSVAQQKYFYARSSDPSLPKKERKKWGKMAKEFSKHTDFKKLPEKKDEMDEIVDTNGNISRTRIPQSLKSKGITQDKTSDEVVKAGAGSMGTHGVHGTHTTLRYWAESDMSKALGYKETLGSDISKEKAERYMEKELGLSDDEAEERLDAMGYDEDLKDDKVRLIENPKKYIEEYIENILSKKSKDHEFVEGNNELKEVTPIIKRQIGSLKDSLKSHGLSLEDVKEYFKENE